MNEMHPLIEQYYNTYTAIRDLAEKKIKERGEIDFSCFLTDNDEEYNDERPNVVYTDRHDFTMWDVVEKVYWNTERNIPFMHLGESNCDLPLHYCDGFTAFSVYRDVLLVE